MADTSFHQAHGVTEQMVAEFGDQIFELSHNKQTRIGDPVRELDWDAVEAGRDGMGLTDGEVAERLGLEVEQVTFIRTLVEWQRFHTGHYKRLYKLGGGKRYRPEREKN
ncbi:MAG: hypothetical protein VYE18_03900 [Pseudomonadota bacterium]|nr:hypothetical protein [Pseudomonadota bacterium]